MQFNLNTNPYYDDFDGTKNHHQILFKPGYAVQARELTQIQSILKDQIKKFGDHVFQHGSVVIPGNSYADLAASYVKIDRAYLGETLELDQFVGASLASESGVTATVRLVRDFGDQFVVFYISYTSGGGGESMFSRGQTLRMIGDSQTAVTVHNTEDAVGVGSIVVINQGVYYVNGVFAYVPKQAEVMSRYTSLPSCSVILRVGELIVTSNQDETLLDSAQGSYNFAAPGADRLQMTLTLAVTDIGEVPSDDVIEIMRYEDGELLEHARHSKYSELDKSLARRTYDESGDYVVAGMEPSVREHRRAGNNNGLYANGNKDLMVVEVSPGKVYIQGFEVEKLGRTKIVVDKARMPEHIKGAEVNTRPNFGSYLMVSDIVGAPSVANHEKVQLWNCADTSDFNAAQVGSARVVSIDYMAGDPEVDPLYKLYITDLELNPGITLASVGAIKFGLAGTAVVLTELGVNLPFGTLIAGETLTAVSGRTASVKYWDPVARNVYVSKHDATKETPRASDEVTASVSLLEVLINAKLTLKSAGANVAIFPLSKGPAYSLRTEAGAYQLSYTVQKELLITTDASGNGSVSVPVGAIMPIEVGTFLALGAAGKISNALFAVSPGGDALTITGGPASAAVRVYCNVQKTNVSPKSKTLTLASAVVTAGNQRITLTKYDVHRIKSVVQNGADVTALFKLHTGQTNYRYGLSYLTAKSGTVAGEFTVTFEYFKHSTNGDFFCVDSYAANPDHLDLEVSYTIDQREIDLLNCIDFRPGVGENNELSGTGASKNDLLVPATAFKSALRYFVPRIDTLVVSKNGGVSVLRGVPSDTPKAAGTTPDRLALNMFFVPAYTKSVSMVSGERVSVDRFTMGDIKKIETRIERLEEFATLTAAETATASYEIVDAATGLNRFKTGYVVESFESPLAMARTLRKDYAASFVDASLCPGVETLHCDVTPIDYTNLIQSAGYLMLPYTEQVFAAQPLSSRVTNINPFMVVSWDGVLQVVPPADEWVDTVNLSDVFESKEDVVIVPPPPPPLPRPRPPPPPPPPSVESPLSVSPGTSMFHIPASGVGASTGTFTVTNIGSELVTVVTQTISSPSGGSAVCSPVSFPLDAGASRVVTFAVTSASNRATSYAYEFAVMASGFAGRYPTHKVTQNRAVSPPPPPPTITYVVETVHGGLYGYFLGREADQSGIDWWATAYNTEGIESLAAGFLAEARANAELGGEPGFRASATVKDVIAYSGNKVLSATNTNKYEVKTYADGVTTKKLVSSAASGTRLDGSKFTS